MNEELTIQQDRMRFCKNTTSSRLALLAIVFNMLYFISIYKVNHAAYYTWWMGVSIVYNLVFMLAAFLASEGTKNYKENFSTVLIVLGILQIVRIFILPATMHTTLVDEAKPLLESEINFLGYHVQATVDNVVMNSAQYFRVILYLAASAVCLLASAIINRRKSKALAAHIANLNLHQA